MSGATAARMRAAVSTAARPARLLVDWLRAPPSARAAMIADRRLAAREDPGIERTLEEVIGWLSRAQDCSASRDGGVARDFSLVKGWATSYPETTGYIVPTLLEYARGRGQAEIEERARRMLDWLLAIQMPCGAFQGGRVDSRPRVPVVFNTGQILMGLASGAARFGEPYLTAMHRAARWLVGTQDGDGCWRRHASPFAMPGDKAYDTHVAWGLLEAHRVDPCESYLGAALRNAHWAASRQRDNGWLDDCCLSDRERPLTHTLGYALRGILESYLTSGDRALLAASERLARGLLGTMRADGFLPGRLRPDWRPAAKWACLTGTVQVACCWLLLHQITSDEAFRDAALVANRFVRSTVALEGPPGIRGGVKGSHPIDGDYGRFEYLNWAAKFLVDALLLEGELRGVWKGSALARAARGAT